MSKRMLIDATHAEETRVVVMDGNRLEDYDVESAAKKQLKGNIYLARVVRVEPSLQAAFVEYGGNRHGFLAFSEIHPDYYQIPVSDREKLLALQAEEEALLENAENGADEDDASDNAEAQASDTEQDTEASDTSAQSEDEGSEREERSANKQDAPDYVGGETDTGEEALFRNALPDSCATIAFRKLSAAARCCWCRWLRKNVATRAQPDHLCFSGWPLLCAYAQCPARWWRFTQDYICGRPPPPAGYCFRS